MRFDQCTETCTTDCGHCKGRPVEALRAEVEKVWEEVHQQRQMRSKSLAEVASLRQQLDDARAETLRVNDCFQWYRLAWSRVRADRDRLLVVYRAAEAWAAADFVERHHEFLALRSALAAYRAAAPAEPAAVWTPAKDGDTPGQRDIEDDPPQPVVAGVPVDTEETPA